MDKMRHGEAEPVQAIAGMGDHPTAVALYASIVTALLQREKTGRGTKVHTSLIANGVWSASCLVQAELAGADFSPMPAQRITTAIYQASDGRWLQLSMVRTDEDFDRLLIGLKALDMVGDERYASYEARVLHADELTRRLREIFLTRTSDEWVRILKEELKVPVERVTRFADLREDPHMTLNGMMASPAEDVGIDYIINDPVNVEGVRRIGAKKAPGIGEHTDEVLGEMGFSDAEIASLRDQGVIG